MNNNTKKKVVVGLSGGVDSSVAALLLKKAGYDVIGITLNVWQNDSKETNSSIKDAKCIADKLKIPFYELDVRSEFKKYVIDYFAQEYIAGRTPNPCTICNKYIKFGILLDKALEEFGADYIATGHYAKVEYDKNINRYYLKESATAKKDQTYALYMLSQEQLKHVLMPLGEYTKEQIREIAKQNGLITAEKQDSQEICFVENNDYADFIEKKYNYTPIVGEFIDTKGNKYGKHKGIIHYTVGQRRGLGLSLKSPLYVKALNPKSHEVLLCSKDELYSDSLVCNNINLMAIERLDAPTRASVKIRYSAPKVMATLISIDENSIKIVFDEPQKAITPGQAAVFYNGSIVIGGGTIM